MATLLLLIMVVAWIWSVARGVHVSFLCVVLNFLFPPISQGIFSIYEEKMRPPFFLMLACFALLLLFGEPV